jgi:hypothetical protein
LARAGATTAFLARARRRRDHGDVDGCRAVLVPSQRSEDFVSVRKRFPVDFFYREPMKFSRLDQFRGRAFEPRSASVWSYF